jgi:hypothetical protein
MQDAAWNIDISDIYDLFIDILVLIYHAKISPNVIIIIGVNLIIDGSIRRLLVIDVSQLIILPAVIDINPSNNVGIIISIFSLILIKGLHKLGPHITTILNRTE